MIKFASIEAVDHKCFSHLVFSISKYHNQFMIFVNVIVFSIPVKTDSKTLGVELTKSQLFKANPGLT